MEIERFASSRRMKRNAVEKFMRELEEELKKEEKSFLDIDSLVLEIEKIEAEIMELDEKVINGMMDANVAEAAIQADMDLGYDFFRKIKKLKLQAHRSMTPASNHGNQDMGLGAEAGSTSSHGLKKKCKLPKLEMKKFNGEHTEWLSWWAQFEKIHLDEDLDDSDKFQYLAQVMVEGSRPSKIVNGFPATKDNYPKVIAQLKEIFGDPIVLLEVYTMKVLKIVLANINSRDNKLKCSMVDELEANFRALESLGVEPLVCAAILYPLVVTSLPDDLLQVWQRSSLSGYNGTEALNVRQRLQNLMRFMAQEVKGAERIEFVRSGLGNKKTGVRFQEKKDEDSIPTAAALLSGKVVCIFCENAHPSQNCIKAQRMSNEEKREKVKNSRCCFRCLKSGHSIKDCRTTVKCNNCTKPHLSVLCYKGTTAARNQNVETVLSGLNCSSKVMLQTLQIKLRFGNKEKIVRAIYDVGSTYSYVLKDTVKALQLRPTGQKELGHELFGGAIEYRWHDKYIIKALSMDGKYSTNLEVMDIQKICSGVPRMPKGPWLKELNTRRIRLSDVGKDWPDIQVLIGADYYGQLVSGKVMQLQNGLSAMETKLGWTVIGKVNSYEENVATAVTSMHVCSSDVSELWKLETIGITDPVELKTKQEEDAIAKEYFLETVKRSADGRYEVSLPWMNRAKVLPSNRIIAEKRLTNSTKKLIASGVYEDYDKIFKDWENEGIIEEIQDDQKENCFYLPHRAVIKPESKTTPVRPVFDASVKNFRSPSLNESLYKGPNLLELIGNILIKFRERKIGVLSDIRKAFQMIELLEEDRDFVRFLWWSEPEKKYKVYRHRRVVFGVNSSPFLLAAVLEYHLGNVADKDKPYAKKLFECLYVDNCVTSVDTMEEYEDFKTQTVRILADAMFELRQWEFGPEVPRVGSPECGLGTETVCSLHQSSTSSVLGLQWDKKKDTLSCDVEVDQFPVKITKRSILSLVQKVFDPIGFTSPAMLVPKMLMQEAWALKLDWDKELPMELKDKFSRWYEELQFIKKIGIPRFFTSPENEGQQLHVFTDASKDAYAAVVFLRSGFYDVKVHLVQAKSRVAPLKKGTIPRLELLGCTIGARLVSSLKESFEVKNIPITYWTDSTTALAWIRRNDDWGTFVGNRVREICKLTRTEDWRHVPGILNPADLPSRGCTPKELLESKWWEGPDWLRKPEEFWPKSQEKFDEEAVLAEKKKSAAASMINVESDPVWYLPKSSYLKNVRVMAWIQRFIFNCKNNHHIIVGKLSVDEIEEAELKICKLVQKSRFPKVGGSVEGIKVYCEKNGLIRLKTKLLHRDDSEDFRLPILLPNSHPMVSQLIEFVHKSNGHAGVQFVVSKLREKFWILQSRRAVRKVLHGCVTCRRFTGKAPEVPVSALPEDRVKDAKAFEVSGVDLAGPLYLKNGEKVWLVLYTCAVFRCVHLELVNSLSTEEFVLSLIRFIARRGRPKIMHSDNGRNFVGANSLFSSIDWNQVEEEAKVKQIEWKFIPPTAAWWGGFWERMIRSVKDLLKRMLGNGRLDYVQLETCLCEAEAIVNSRPLTYVTEDPEDLIPLTPAMFIQDPQEVSFPELECFSDEELRAKYRRIAQLRKDLRQRFRTEYLGLLLQRSKDKKSEVLKPGEVVLVSSDNKKRLEWPMAVVLELIPGKDGFARVAKIRTGGGILLRPVQRLFKLEVSGAVPEEIPLPKGLKEKQLPDVKDVVTRSGRVVKVPQRFHF